MKCAVVGCGAVGSFYGAKLCQSGVETHFLLRSDFDAVQRNGVNVSSIDGDFHVRPRCANCPESIGVADLVLIGLKTTANDQFGRLLPPLVGPATAIVTLQNGLGNEAGLSALFGPQNVLCGLCFVCLNRVAPGRVKHMAHGQIVLGEYQRPASNRSRALAELFRKAGVRCQLTDNIDQAHWEKLVWNIPFNGLGVAGVAGYEAVITGEIPATAQLSNCLTTDQLLGDPRWEQLVRELMFEAVSTARALGHNVKDSFAQENINRTRIMGAYKASTLLDFERGKPLELESMFLEPLRQAQQAGIPAPRLAKLCQALKQLAR